MLVTKIRYNIIYIIYKLPSQCYNTHRGPGETSWGSGGSPAEAEGGDSMGGKRKATAKAEVKAEVKAVKKSQPRRYTQLTLVVKLKLILRRL
jgi:hypothetical protein